MTKGILGRKVGMTSVFDEAGNCLSVTVVEAGPCHVLRWRTTALDGYEAIQLGFSDKPRRLVPRAERGQVRDLGGRRSKKRISSGATPLARADCEPKRFVREFRDWSAPPSVGEQVRVEVLEGVQAVDVTGISKGRGFTGVMKRHNFSGQRASHGVKKVHRHLGSAGCSAFPSRTFKGKRMPGQYGNGQVTARNLKVVQIVPGENLVLVQGAVPGPNGGYVILRETNLVR
ncbi:MAG TPA: 50S ribosomal protein L3 [Pirellulaceae bacterium]